MITDAATWYAFASAITGVAAWADPYIMITNDTPYTIYYQFYNGGDGTYDGFETLDSGDWQSFTILGKAQVVKMTFTPDPDYYPFQMEYTMDTDLLTWDMSAKDGDQFINYTRIVTPLAPSDGKCQTVICATGYDGPECEYTTDHDYDSSTPVCPIVWDTDEPQLTLVVGGGESYNNGYPSTNVVE